ncbi:MAG: C40 family peptidase [Fimbriimonadaceae bacterium]|nr:C40 family peptidase [Fimbriimonadaceae bacterium]
MKRALLVGVCVGLLGRLTAATVYEVYRVQTGDTPEAIAVKHGMSVDELRALNPFLLTSSLTPNELITVMIRDGGPTPAGAGRGSGGGDNGAGSISAAAGLGGAKIVGEGAPTNSLLGGPGDSVSRPAVTPPRDSGPAQAAQQQALGGDRNFAVNGAVGRLGIVKGQGALILRDRYVGAQELYTCPQGTRLALRALVSGWYAVLMVDGSTGYLAANDVTLTNTDLVQTNQVAGNDRGSAAIREAYRYLGVRYVWGGESFSGIDCSGLVLRCYRKLGVNLPRVARDQFRVGTPVRYDQLQAGDRIYFSSDGGPIDHTGMYIGGGQFIHASGRRRQVCIDNLFDQRYWSIYVGAKR